MRARPNASRVAALLAVGAAVGCGGSRADVYTLLDDMEGGPGGFTIRWPGAASTTQSYWVTFTDCSQSDRIAPTPYDRDLGGWTYAALPAPLETMPGVPSAHAARVRTTAPLVDVWGGGMGFDLADLGPYAAPGAAAAGAPCKMTSALDVPARPMDLSAFSGLTFWARAGSGWNIVRVLVANADTDPRAGVCNRADPTGDQDCYNHFGLNLRLTDAFAQYFVDFRDLRQDPFWQYQLPSGRFDPSQVYSVNFKILAPTVCQPTGTSTCAGEVPDPPVSFDLWIDDIYLIGK